MSAVNQIIEKYLDNLDEVSDEELRTLVEALKENPKLASDMKAQLVVNELLAQRYGVDRQDFMAQVDQRIRDFKLGEAEIAARVTDLREMAEQGLEEWNQESHRARKRGYFIAAAIVVLIAVSAGTWFVVSPSLMYIAEITIDGGGTFSGPSGEKKIIPGVPIKIKKGDMITTSPSEIVTFKYSDETLVQIGTESSIEFGVGGNRGKKVKVHRGTVSANVAAQKDKGHMTFETNDAEAQVLGTELFLMVHTNLTRLDVIEGSVELVRKDNTSITVQAGNYATSAEMKPRPLTWPTNRKGLVFLIESQHSPNYIFDHETEMNRRCVVAPLVLAAWNEFGAMVLGRGRFEAIGSNRDLLTACKSSNELTIEAVIDPFEWRPRDPGSIVVFSKSEEGRNFELVHEGETLYLRLRTADVKDDANQTKIALCQLPDHKAHHVLVAFRPGRLVCYLDGRVQHNSEYNQGDLSSWTDQRLVFGSEPNGGKEWGGLLEGIALYSRFIEAEEAEANATAYRKVLNERAERIAPKAESK